MKRRILFSSCLAFGLSFLLGCDPDMDSISPSPSSVGSSGIAAIQPGCEVIDFDNPSIAGQVTEVYSNQNSGPVMVRGQRKKLTEGVISYFDENFATIYNTSVHTGDDIDLLTPNENYGGQGVGIGGAAGPYANTVSLGKALIVNETSDFSVPNDNRFGAKLTLDFSAIGPLTLASMTVIDIEEVGSKAILYGSEGQELGTFLFPITGDNGVGNVDFNNTQGVMTMVVIFGAEDIHRGSGAIDNLQFCRPVPSVCTRTQGYWKNHSSYGPAKKTDPTWGGLEDDDFFLSGQTYIEVMNTPPAGGNGYYSLAHQYIAAHLNMLKGASSPPEVTAAFNQATTLLNTYTPAQVKASKSLNQLAKSLAETLERYNSGKIGPGHCTD